MSNCVVKKGSTIVLLASYCEEDNEDCSERHPCDECLQMCNTLELDADVDATFIGSLEYNDE